MLKPRPAPAPMPAAFALLALASTLWAGGVAAAGYVYTSPMNGAERVSPWNNVVLRADQDLDARSVGTGDIVVSGSRSGDHAGRVVLADDGRTVVFTPDEPFAPGERVTVTLGGEIRARGGNRMPVQTIRFTVSAVDPKRSPARDFSTDPCLPWAGQAARTEALAREGAAAEHVESAQALLPTGYPAVSLLTSNNPEAGALFVSPFQPGNTGHLMVLDNLAQPLFYRRLSLFTFDFKRQPDGRLTFWGGNNKFYALDSAYTVVDSFATGNGYTTDLHECVVLANGHALLMSYDVQPVDMSLIVQGGRADAMVVGLIVQEIDNSNNVVFQWRSWDHFQITDMANSCLESLTDSLVDYVHGNAIDLDSDGNLLISSRSLNEITKINRTTGAVMWRFGLYATQNDFTILNDTRGFRGQHDIRRLPNGNLILYDNGNCNATEWSRAVEYDMDEVGMSATQVWEGRVTPDRFGPFMGSAQRHASGKTLIGWGGTNGADVTELDTDGTKALEISLGGPIMWSYRAYRFPWTTSLFAASPAVIDFASLNLGASGDRTVTVHNRSGASLEIDGFVTSDPAFSVTTAAPFTIPPGGTTDINVRFQPTEARAYDAQLYVRSVDDTSLVAQAVNVKGYGVTYLPATGPAALALVALLLAAIGVPVLLRAGAREV
jgi:hypothetical protein